MSTPNKASVSYNQGDRYRTIIENIDHLPSLPVIVTQLMKVVNSPETSADDAARLIEKDPALTSKILRLANSAFYGIPRTVSSVSSAVVILGFNVIRSLALAVSVMKMFPEISKPAIQNKTFWIHSIVTAMAAREITRRLMCSKMMDPESAFCAGILHDIGKLIFNVYLDSDYQKACDFAKKNGIALTNAETEILGINHADVGRLLADKWALPLDLEYSIVFHHRPSEVDQQELVDLVTIVHVADHIAHEAGASLWKSEEPSPLWNEALSIVRLDRVDYEGVTKTIAETMKHSSEFLSIYTS